MKIFTETFPFRHTDPTTLKFFHEKSFFFDIETTGFSAKYCTVYFIGCAARTGDSITVTLFFAENPKAEADVLTAFFDYCISYTSALTFNGLGFDVPFLEERCRKLGISSNLTDLEHTDIFKKLTPFKKIFHLPGMKQKSIEAFLSIHREDIYSGGELISVYQDYCKSPDPKKLDLLTLHNKEDVLGMIELLPALAYPELFGGNFEVTGLQLSTCREYEGNTALEAYLTLRLSHPLPKRISHRRDDLYLSAHGDTARLKVKVFEGELKYFYPNYKDYCYLPKEDMAVHKSVAFYVDKEYRTPAKAATCYTKKTGQYLPQYKDIVSPSFKQEYKDKTTYIELTEAFMHDKDQQKQYAQHLLEELLK